jgi:AraC-like DNA-binding protein
MPSPSPWPTCPSRLAHLFKQHTHRSILAYLHEYRIGRIREEFLRTDTPVTDLAATLGYGDLRFCHRVVRRQVGYSPTAYRRLFRQGTDAHIVKWCATLTLARGL